MLIPSMLSKRCSPSLYLCGDAISIEAEETIPVFIISYDNVHHEQVLKYKGYQITAAEPCFLIVRTSKVYVSDVSLNSISNSKLLALPCDLHRVVGWHHQLWDKCRS
jgi:hypothetical protein